MGDSLRLVVDSTVNAMPDIVRDTVDWVQECAYRQAMLIDRIDVWMEFVKWGFWLGATSVFLYCVLDSVFDFDNKHHKRKTQ